MQGQLLEEVRLAIGIPTTGLVHSDFSLCLAMLSHDLSFPLHMVKKHTFSIYFEKGSMLAQQRETIVEIAQAGKATHLLMIDTDHAFPQQLARVLLSRRVSVIAVNCVTKTFPAVATARDDGGTAGLPIRITAAPDTACRKVWRVGTGISLFDMKVFDKLKQPYFGVRWDEKRRRHVYEDWVLMEKLEAAGVPIYIDQQIAPLVQHIGTYSFSYLDQAAEEPEQRKELPLLEIVR